MNEEAYRIEERLKFEALAELDEVRAQLAECQRERDKLRTEYNAVYDLGIALEADRDRLRAALEPCLWVVVSVNKSGMYEEEVRKARDALAGE